MLTDFGIAVRKLRLDRGLKLRDMADRLDLTSTFVSAIETGRKPIPRGYVTAIAESFELTEAEETELERAADKTRTTVHIDNLAADDRRLVASFARRVNELPPEILESLRKLLKSIVGEVPFRRRRSGFLVPARSRATILEIADKVRDFLDGDDDRIKFPIIEVLEFAMPNLLPGFYIDVCDEKVMGADEGRVVSGTDCIMLRCDVYDAACDGQGRARFTVCHEFGHFLMHRNITMARTRQDHHPVYRDSEWQADFFAGCLLMSKRHLLRFRDADDAARRCGMSREAARVMWTKLRGVDA